jgi:4-alpha-glucanotransferase
MTHAVDAGAATGLIDYAAHRAAHRPALETAFARFEAGATPAERQACDAFRAMGGQALLDFARFEALSESHGADSRKWPAETARAPVAPERVAFHIWLQWRADRQLGAAQDSARGAGMALGLYLDLAVGPRLGGAETWGAASAAATGVSLGAPPDQLSPAGQNWQLAALSPNRLRAGRYAALRFVLRQNMRHCGLLRIDHALGLNRSFWLPEDGTPGGYIRQPFDALMAVIAIEAERAGCVVVGEDLGLVPEGFREDMARRGLYGYSVLQYEKDANGHFLPPEALRPQTLACFATHDTPTLAGFWQGRDIAWWERLGWVTQTEAARAMDGRQGEKRDLAGLAAPAPLPPRAGPGLRDTVHARLAQSPAALVAVQLDDILCIEEAQNLPGTVDEHPNWRRRCPQTLQEIETGPDLDKTASIMAHAGRAPKLRKETT